MHHCIPGEIHYIEVMKPTLAMYMKGLALDQIWKQPVFLIRKEKQSVPCFKSKWTYRSTSYRLKYWKYNQISLQSTLTTQFRPLPWLTTDSSAFVVSLPCQKYWNHCLKYWQWWHISHNFHYKLFFWKPLEQRICQYIINLVISNFSSRKYSL